MGANRNSAPEVARLGGYFALPTPWRFSRQYPRTATELVTGSATCLRLRRHVELAALCVFEGVRRAFPAAGIVAAALDMRLSTAARMVAYLWLNGRRASFFCKARFCFEVCRVQVSE